MDVINQVGIIKVEIAKTRHAEAKILMEAFCSWHQYLKKNPLPDLLDSGLVQA
jgi:hypothetical protein